MKKTMLSAIVALGLVAPVLASGNHPPISFVIPGGGSTAVDKSQFLVLVVDAGFVTHDGNPIPGGGLVAYVNNVLKAQGASYLGIHIRQGIKYGDVVRALDELRKTEAKSIGVSMAELAPGREP